ncbi:hypothetical protein M2158_008157 [Streptomyces sp. SAI-144]|uniref:hypothetical protein n=1 Tax=unclassified Streptomyces TaxID=2593676 RepID=UPI0024764A6D|nr:MULTISPECIES: hypothetical protein [unclassified Streptomyces]MDH6439616.1 hypothetical protein [Streptomyces sp. SAI-144]MDH6486907.1 hypothetical protein [Streptomyces sp. SAI-127]
MTPRSCSSPRRDSKARTPSPKTTAPGYVPAFTHPDHAPDTWHQWQHTTGRQLAAAGLPVRLNPGQRISLTIPAEALRQMGSR